MYKRVDVSFVYHVTIIEKGYGYLKKFGPLLTLSEPTVRTGGWGGLVGRIFYMHIH